MKEENKRLNAYMFNVDVLIEEETNAKAYELLLKLLNSSVAADFRVQKGVELGKVIDQYITAQNVKEPTRITKSDSPAESVKTAAASVVERIQGYIAANRLVRLHVNKGLGIKLSIPCRIISFNETNLTITVYHVDEKQVYTFSINEIDDFLD
ncbi:hypothetical protein AB6A23_07700 [Paenibacillus tarimensis]